MNRMFIIPILSLLVSVIIWGYNFIVTKELLSVLSPTALAFYSTFGTAVMLVLMFNKGLFSYPKQVLIQTFIASFFGIFLFNILLNYGMKKTSPIDAALIIALIPCISNFVHCLWLNNKLRVLDLFATFLSVAGIMLLVTNGDWSHFLNDNLYGDSVIFLATFCFVIYISLGKRSMEVMKSTHYTTWCFLFGSLLLFIPACILGNLQEYMDLSVGHVSYLLYAIFCTGIIANVAYNFGVRTTNIVTASLFSNSIPIFTMMFSVLIYSEHLSSIKTLAAIFVIIGIALPSVAYRGKDDNVCGL